MILDNNNPTAAGTYRNGGYSLEDAKPVNVRVLPHSSLEAAAISDFVGPLSDPIKPGVPIDAVNIFSNLLIEFGMSPPETPFFT